MTNARLIEGVDIAERKESDFEAASFERGRAASISGPRSSARARDPRATGSERLAKLWAGLFVAYAAAVIPLLAWAVVSAAL